MKTLLLLALLFTPTFGFCQITISDSTERDATFPGGLDAWKHYLVTNLDYDLPARNGIKAGTYTVIIDFVIRKDGKITNLKPKTELGFGMEEEAMRVIRIAPNWIPARQHGELVAMWKEQPVTFIIVNEKQKKKKDN